MTVSTSFAGRFRRRMRVRRVSRAKVLLTALGLAALVAAAGWVLLGSSLLGVSSVQVEGASRVETAEVLQAAGIDAGIPLARLDTDAVAARVAALPAVATVDVRRKWPRGVTIAVRERVAAATRAIGTDWQLIDRSGVGFAVEPRRPRHLPVITAPSDAGPRTLRAALNALDAVPRSVREQVRQVRAASADDVTLLLSRGRTVVWGTGERAARKGAVLAVLLSRKASIYDVSAPDAPTTRK